MADIGALSAKKNAAIASLLSCRSVLDAAALAGVSPRTLYRWLGESDFRSALSEAEGDMLDAATRRLAGLADQAVGALADNLSQETPAYVRLKAAQSTLDFLLKLRSQREIETRLSKLEAALHD